MYSSATSIVTCTKTPIFTITSGKKKKMKKKTGKQTSLLPVRRGITKPQCTQHSHQAPLKRERRRKTKTRRPFWATKANAHIEKRTDRQKRIKGTLYYKRTQKKQTKKGRQHRIRRDTSVGYLPKNTPRPPRAHHKQNHNVQKGKTMPDKEIRKPERAGISAKLGEKKSGAKAILPFGLLVRQQLQYTKRRKRKR